MGMHHPLALGSNLMFPIIALYSFSTFILMTLPVRWLDIDGINLMP